MTTNQQAGTKVISRNKLLGIAGVGWMFDALDVGILSFVIAALAKEWMLSPSEMGWIGSVNSIGMAVGAFVFGILADRIGRKSVFIWTLVIFSIASGLSALTTTLAAFMILRFFIGMGLGGELPVASTLVSESVASHERGRVVVLLESFWAGGWLLAALISYFVIPNYGWRIALLLTALPAVYAIYLRLHLPDSPQFTAKKDVVRNIGQNIKDVWSKEYARRTLMLWIVWFTVVFSYYGMFLWLPSVMVMKGFSLIASFKYVLIMTLAQLPGYFTAAWLIERAGRKFVLATYLLGTAVSALVFGNAETIGLLLVAGMFLSFFNLGAWGALYAYTPEQYPTIIRGTGAGMAASVGRLGGIFGPLLVGSLVAKGYELNLIFGIFCISIIVGVVAIIALGTETKQTELE
ncbi:MFS transporter [Viridibacillus sp. FSL R5-0477]|uniref:Metabolite transport protein n=1 Tax=Viridibacillus arenosi FSL R5-213 TaxID=1227360 RepID=W4ESX7_9BACL|nr:MULTISPECIES: MFS transporter [Viridibacillus]ETT82906.1 metabolite transport protein [Viridibacillus arenosi FSL R5-213]OMC82146.1 MFS transporter [Viridibacillus sp. FSL H8-0123]OMC86303.1 MFS transporter [Viridibacillus sp. FSL H7-0596]OMC90793.1 MFS transporter [Viridibacillus arenosi]